MVFISITQVFGELGLGSGLIQAKAISKVQINTIFLLNMLLGAALTVVTFLSADLIAAFYDKKQIIPIVQSLSVLFFARSLSIIPRALLKKKVNFKSISIINMIGLVFSGTIGIVSALNGFGLFALVIQYIAEAIISAIVVWFFVKWRPSADFSLKSIRPIWAFSINLFYAGILDVVFNRADIMIIGKIFSAATLGFYTRAIGFYRLIIRYSSDSISQIFFPVFSQIQEDLIEIKRLVIKSFHIISFVIFFLIGFFHLVSDEFIILLLTDKWIQTSEYFKILLLSAFAYPLSITMMNVLTGLGKSKVYLRIEFAKKGLLLLSYVIGFQFGIVGFLYALIINRLLSTIINIYYGGKEINARLLEFARIIIIYILPSITSYLIAFGFASWLNFESDFLISFMIKGFLFTLIYILYNSYFKQPGFEIAIGLISKFKKAI